MFKKIIIVSLMFLSLMMGVNSALDTNLIQYYSFDVDGTDSIGNYHTTKLTGNLVIGKIGNGRDALGSGTSSNHIRTIEANTNIPNTNANVTICGWIDWGTLTGSSTWIMRTVSSVNQNAYPFALLEGNAPNTLNIFSHDGVSLISESGIFSVTNDGNYHFYCFQRANNGANLIAYEDNVLLVDTPVIIRNQGVVIDNFGMPSGAVQNAYGSSGAHKFDELGIWTRVLSLSEMSQLYNNGNGNAYPFNPIQMIINTPSDLTNYTFDVTSAPIDVTTAVNTNCSYTNDYDNNTILFSTTGGLSHQTILTLPSAINQSQTFNVDVTCNNVGFTQSQILTLFKQRIPLNLNIIVPQENQIFNVDTGEIEFFLETNYQTDCSYKRDTDSTRTVFTSTGGAIHKTNFSTDLNISTYYMNFLCIGNIINENASKNITFFLDNLPKYTGLSRTTNQLPQVGEDMGSFMTNVTPGITEFIFNLAIIIAIISFISIIVIVIKKYIK